MPMQTQAPQAPTPPPTPVIVIPGVRGAEAITIPTPRTAQDLEALRNPREELSNQLISVDGRRSELITQPKTTADPVVTKGLQERLALLDARQLQLESDIQAMGQQLTSASAGMIATTTNAPMLAGLGSGQVLALSIVFTVCVLGPLALGFARLPL